MAAINQHFVAVTTLLAIGLSAPLAARRQNTDRPAETADVDRLRALPYVSHSTEIADPEQSGVVMHRPEAVSPGFNLYSNRHPCRAQLVDLYGRVVHVWRDPEPCRRWSVSELLPDGNLLVLGIGPFDEADPATRDKARFLLRLTWDNEVVWRAQIPAHHDVELTPGGDLLTLTMADRRLPEVDADHPVIDHSLTLLSADGTVLRTLSLYELLRDNGIGVEVQPVEPMMGKTDLVHANAAEWMRQEHLFGTDPLYDPQHVLVTLRHQDAVAVVDWEWAELVWAWGPGELSGPHDATLLPSGHLLIFDNGLSRAWSRVIELDPIRREIVWEYRAPEPTDFFTITRGASQRLDNGNTLITNTESGQVFEVTPNGEVVWEFWNPQLNDAGRRSTLLSMRRYQRDRFAQIRRYLTAEPSEEGSAAWPRWILPTLIGGAWLAWFLLSHRQEVKRRSGA